MDRELPVDTPNERVAWAVDKVKRDGVVLEALAERMGCSHATLSQWQTGATNIDNVKVGLLTKFCDATDVSLRWILTGDGPRIDAYSSSASAAVLDLSRRLSTLQARSPETFDIVAKMVEAAAAPPTSSPDGARPTRPQ